MNCRSRSSRVRYVWHFAALTVVCVISTARAQVASPGYRAIPLKSSNAADVAPRLRESLAGMGVRALVYVDIQENQILVNGAEDALRVAQQLLQTLDQPAAENRSTEVRGYRVVGDMQAAATSFQQQFSAANGTRAIIDDRTQQLIVVATPETHRAIAARIQSGGLPLLRDTGEVSNAQAASGTVYQLRRLKAGQLEEELQRMWLQRLAITHSANGQQTQVAVPGPDGPIPVMQIDRSQDRVTFLGNYLSAVTWSNLVQSLDSPGSAEDVTQLISLRNSEPEKVRDAVELLQAASPKRKGEASTGISATRGAARPRVSSDLVSMIFQQAQAAQPAPAPAPAPAQPAPAGQPPAKAPDGQPDTPDALDDAGFFGPVQIDMFLDVLIIRGNRRDVERVRKLIDDIEAIAAKTQPVFEIYYLKHINSESMYTLIAGPGGVYDEILSQRQGQVTMRALVDPNALLLIGRVESLNVVKSLIEKLDQEMPPTSQFEVIRLMHIAAVDAELTVRNFFTAQAGVNVTPRLGLGTRVSIISDYRTNSLIVQASPRDLEEVRRFIRSIDIDSPSAQAQLRIFRLRNALATDLATVLQQAISGQRTQVTGQPGVAAGAGQLGAQQQSTLPSPRVDFIVVDQKTGQPVSGGILADVVVTANAGMNALVVRAPAKSMELMEALIEQLDKLPQVDSQIKVFEIRNGNATALATTLQQLFGQPATAGQVGLGTAAGTFAQQLATATTGGDTSLVPLRFVVDQRTNSIIATGSTDDLLVVNAIITRLDQAAIERKLTVYRLRNTNAASVALAITTYLTNQQTRIQQQLLQGLVINPFDAVEREVFVVAEEVTNSLIFSASPKYFDMIMQVIKDLDVRAPMVKVDVLIAEIVLDDFYEFGAEFGLQDSLLFNRGIAAGTNASVPGFNFGASPVSGMPNLNTFGREQLAGQSLTNFALGRTNTALGFGGLVLSAANESVSILIRALEQEGRAQILSRPHVMTMHNQPAYVQVGADVARIQGTNVQQNTVTLDTADVPTGIILSILPLINDDGVVVMGVEAQRSALGNEADGTPIGTDSAGNPIIVPPINITRASTTVSTMDGQTIVLAGLITKDRATTNRRIPYLSNVPVLGDLFQFERDVIARRELLIVLTPHIMRNENDLEMAKVQEAERMSWCLADVLDVGGDPNLPAGNCLFCKSDTPVIYPDITPMAPPAMAAKSGAPPAGANARPRGPMMAPVPQAAQAGPGFDPPPVMEATQFQSRIFGAPNQASPPAQNIQSTLPPANGIAPANFQPPRTARLPLPN